MSPLDAPADQALFEHRDHPLLDGLNEPQRAAVTHAGAPLLVVAGAGSGKTRVLTRRIAWLINERKAHPGSILAITFTNKAAAERKKRVGALVGKRARIMWVSTFHSACVRILRKEIDRVGFKSNFSIYDAADSKRLMPLVLRALDFDDLIMTTVHLLQAFPAVRENYRRRFRHVLVDEYQDTNHAQYSLIQQLCGQSFEIGTVLEEQGAEAAERVEPSELMVVGDADQSIYAFRGADIRNIMDFEQDFPDA